MQQAWGGANLREKPLASELGPEIRMQHLDGDIAVVPDVVRQIDCGHAALANLPLHAIAVG